MGVTLWSHDDAIDRDGSGASINRDYGTLRAGTQQYPIRHLDNFADVWSSPLIVQLLGNQASRRYVDTL